MRPMFFNKLNNMKIIIMNNDNRTDIWIKIVNTKKFENFDINID